MSLSRWKLMAGVLGVSIGGLAAAASQCPKFDSSKGRSPEAPVAKAEPKVPPAGPASLTAPPTTPAAPSGPALPPLPDLAPPSIGPAVPAAPALTPAGATVLPPTPPAPAMPMVGVLPAIPTDVGPAKPVYPAQQTPPVLPGLPGTPSVSAPAKPADPKPSEPAKPAVTPLIGTTPPVTDLIPPAPGKPEPPKPQVGPAAVVQGPNGEPVQVQHSAPPAFPPAPPGAPVASPPNVGSPTVPPPVSNNLLPPPPVVPDGGITSMEIKAAKVATPFRILLRVGEGTPTFEVKNGDNLVLKVACEKVDIKSPEKGGLSEVTARGKVRFAGFGAEGSCDELKFLAGTGEVSMTGEVKVQVKDKLGRVESELTTGSMKYKIDASSVGGVLKP